jgi:hypothetical protein
MSCNKFKQHVLVIPEDDANSQLATGFALGVQYDRKIQILPAAGGWLNVCEIFVAEHISGMYKYDLRHLVLLLDFDNQPNRMSEVNKRVPADLKDRVFLIGAKSEPEDLRRAGLGSFEQIGKTLAIECRNNTSHLWSHNLLAHNASERSRLEQTVRAFLF